MNNEVIEPTSVADRIAEGARVRRAVLGDRHVDGSGGPRTIFAEAFEGFTNDHCWGNVWVRPGLDRKTRSMLNLAMLSALGRWEEFETHLRGAVNNGATQEEILEVILQAGVYAGVPVAAMACRIAERFFTSPSRADGAPDDADR